MKTALSSALFFLSVISILAQDPVPNGDFEEWLSATNRYPSYYPYSSNQEVYYYNALPFNMTKSSDAFHGSFAVQLETVMSVNDTVVAYVINSPYSDGELNTWHGGVPYTQMPTGIRGYYKYNVESDDSAFVAVAFSKNGVNIGTYMVKLGGIKSTYTSFNVTFDPPLQQTPDSVLFGAASSDVFDNIMAPGSILLIDSITLTGVASQPEFFNGDFEDWQEEVIYRPADWYSDPSGVSRTTDSYNGTYALELETYHGNDDGTEVAKNAQVSTGYYSEECDCMLGGYPFSNIIDTLVFYYKYTPAVSTDSAEIFMTFRKNGTQVGGAYKKLQASESWTYYEIPVESYVEPDSATLTISSSLWYNQDISYTGASLKIDNIKFRSQIIPSAIEPVYPESDIKIYPNPTDGVFTIQFDNNTGWNKSMLMEIINMEGQSVLKISIDNEVSDYSISNLQEGVYLIKITDGNNIYTKKILKK